MRQIDADELRRRIIAFSTGSNTTYLTVENIVTMINKADTVDAVPVVPCKGCEHAERYARTDGTAGYYCGHPQNTFVYGERWDRVFKPVKNPDDFCSFGEPRGAQK